MAIPSKRFDFLDQETNIGTSDFLDAKSSSIFNSSNNSFTGIDSDLEGFITNFFQQGKTTPQEDTTNKNTLGIDRITGALTGSIRDLSSLNTRDIDNAIAGVIPDPTLQSAFRQVSASCKNSALSPFGYGRPYDLNMGCGNGINNSYGGGCNSAQFSNLLNKLTGGAYNSQYRDINNLMNSLLALSNYGMNMNMCGAFNALLNSSSFSSLPSNSVSRLSSVLLSTANSSRNILGALDISNATVQRPNTNPLLESPDGVVNMFSNYKQPLKMKSTGLAGMNDRVFGAATIFQDDWDKSKYDNIPSTVNLGKFNEEFDKTMTAKLMNNVGNEDDLDNIPTSNLGLLKLGYNLAA